MVKRDEFGRKWIISNAQEILQDYSDGITVRQLYYRLVSRGLPNGQKFYSRVVQGMIAARWDGDVNFSDFIDRERDVCGETKAEKTILEDKVEAAIDQVSAWMNAYHKNKWENQNNYVEVWVEKKALQGVFEGPCEDMDVALSPCKGYPSLSFLYEAVPRFTEAQDRGQNPIIIYFGDYDPSGEDIPRSIQEKLGMMGANIDLVRIALTEDVVNDLQLPAAPTKMADPRAQYWDGHGQVELDSIEPRQLAEMCEDAISRYFDEDKYQELMDQEREERKEFQEQVKDKVIEMME